MIYIIGQKFYFNNEDCELYSASIASLENDGFTFNSGSEIEYIKNKSIKNSEYTLLGYNQNSPLIFPLEIICDKEYTAEDITTLKDWLFGSFGYKKLVIMTTDLSNYYFNCVLKPNQDYIINGKFKGLSINVECDSPYAWQDITNRIIPTSNPFIYDLNNKSSELGDVLPTVEFVLKGSNKNLSIKNETKNNIDFKWTGLNNNEKIIFDNKSGIIQSYLWVTTPTPAHYDINPVSRLSCFNLQFLQLVKGNNHLIISGTDGNNDIADYIDIKYKRAVRIGGGII